MTANVETMAYSGEVPWHGLGVDVSDKDLSTEEMMEKAGVNWTVSKRELFHSKNGTMHTESSIVTDALHISGQQALVRDTDNQFYGIVGKNWHPNQNDAFFPIVEPYVRDGDLEWNTMGSLNYGQTVWGLLKMKPKFVLFDDDLTELYLLMVNPHQYGKTIHVRSTHIRVVCQNTLSLSLAGSAQVSANQSHREVFDAEQMLDAIGLAEVQLEQYGEMARFLSSHEYRDDSVMDYFSRVFPSMSAKKEYSRNALAAYDLLQSETQPGSEFGRNTWWQAFNTVTYMTDHVIGRNANNRLNSAWLGSNANRKTKALTSAIDYAEAA
jgi:phage/plasmid-like protein (TIGR03299 family)